LHLQCAIFVKIVSEIEGAHIAMTERNVQKIGKTPNKTTDRQSRNVRLFILPSPVGVQTPLIPLQSQEYRHIARDQQHKAEAQAPKFDGDVVKLHGAWSIATQAVQQGDHPTAPATRAGGDDPLWLLWVTH
jgi:hypothetical protein